MALHRPICSRSNWYAIRCVRNSGSGHDVLTKRCLCSLKVDLPHADADRVVGQLQNLFDCEPDHVLKVTSVVCLIKSSTVIH